MITVLGIHCLNQSINQSIIQSINQSINQASKQASKQSINQSIKQSINQSINQSISQSRCRPGSRVDNKSDATPLSDWPISHTLPSCALTTPCCPATEPEACSMVFCPLPPPSPILPSAQLSRGAWCGRKF